MRQLTVEKAFENSEPQTKCDERVVYHPSSPVTTDISFMDKGLEVHA